MTLPINRHAGAKLIREKRKELGLTQADLADKAIVARSTVQEIEKAKWGNLDNIEQVLAALDLSWDDIWNIST